MILVVWNLFNCR